MQKINIPLKFSAIVKNYLWGEEVWSIADWHQDATAISEGPFENKTLRELMSGPQSKSELCGESFDSLNPDVFPLLLKVITSNLALSIQVHPDNIFAEKLKLGELGKSEAWYVVSADEGAIIHCGVKNGVTKNQLKESLKNHTIADLLIQIPVKAGDVINIPAGTIHALGAGVKIIEIQQNSNTTYRLYDWNRVGTDGKPRPLHIDEALKVTKLQERDGGVRTPVMISDKSLLRQRYIECEQFVFEKLSCFNKEAYSFSTRENRSFEILTIIKGRFTVEANGETVDVGPLESLLIPAVAKEYQLFPHDGEASELLRFYRHPIRMFASR